MNEERDTENRFGRLDFKQSDDTIIIKLSGVWKIGAKIPSFNKAKNRLESKSGIQCIAFDASDLTGWDSALLIFLLKIHELCYQCRIYMEMEGLPRGVQRLLDLASAVPGAEGAGKESVSVSFFERVGTSAIDLSKSAVEIVDFIGDASLSFIGLFRGKSGFRWSELFLIIQETGVQALPIVSLISLLVGLILAFVSAMQLMMFGAQIYVASLVGIAMVRVMGAIMTGIIMAGRTGAAFAAQLGTMQVNEEIDALKTLGISPMEFLVLPRIIALVLMMPLLCLYADLMGILGGLIVGVVMLDLNVVEYYNQTVATVRLNDLWIGLFQSSVFGILVALSGCLMGMKCRGSAAAVGDAATSAVVTGIISIVVATAIITVMCNTLGI
ncbi:MAG: hypothetical protein B1H11_08410 [Desulfobacteraceae bacterium 4484_190.1]|nr:ABC transporter permease [Deltaproteobacteria bacterium]OPX35948.1 MAG: hypothetical protein B1H11_08410 [Desulfobacteraceae bacterium 4484_190.1]